MSRIQQYGVAAGTFAVALGIGFVMQNGDALAARFSETPMPALPEAALTQAPDVALASAAAAPRPGVAASVVRDRIEAGITDTMRAAVVTARNAETLPVPVAALEEELDPVPMLAVPEMAELSVPVAVPMADGPAADLPDAPVLLAALEADEVPPVPAPLEMMPVADCAITLGAEVMPAALVELSLSAPCAPLAQATISHQGMQFSVVTDDSGAARMTVPALAEAAVFMAEVGDSGAVAVVTVPDLAEFDRAVLQWQGTVGPEIHALEFGAGYGDAGHVWRGAPASPDVALAGEGGFMVELGDGQGPAPRMAEVYTYPSGATKASGVVAFTVETPVTEATCGRDLQAQTIQVSPGAEPFAFDLTLAVPDCSFAGEILILKDMILDLTVAAL